MTIPKVSTVFRAIGIAFSHTLSKMETLEFKPINLLEHAPICLEFERDMEMLSGNPSGDADDARRGARFLEKIAAKLADDAGSCLHVWRDEVVVGQLHLGRFFEEPVGYIPMFYLAPSYRGLGYAPQLDDYARRHFVARGFECARLSVAASNARARRVYCRLDWRELGARADNPALLSLEKSYREL